MGLEKILDAAYKATLPIRAIDKTVKLGYDALAAATTRVGFDRFRLAGYAVAGAGISAITLAAGFGMAHNFGGAAFYGISSVGFLSLAADAKGMREYSLKPKEVLSYDSELYLRLCRICRYTVIGTVIGMVIAGTAGLLPQLPPILRNANQLTEVSQVINVLTAYSWLYLIDGDHALWDKTKGIAKGAYHKLTSLVPHTSPSPAPQPLPQPGTS